MQPCMQHRPCEGKRRMYWLHVRLENTPPPQARSASVDAWAAGGTSWARPKHPLVRIRLRMTPHLSKALHATYPCNINASERARMELWLYVRLDNTPPPQASASVDAWAAGGTYCARSKQPLVRIRLRMTTQTKRNSHGSIVRSHVRLVPWKSHVNVRSIRAGACRALRMI